MVNKQQVFFAIFATIPLFFGACGACLSKEVPDAATVTRCTLENGLRVVIVQNRLAPVVSTVMNYLVGSNQSPLGFPGMAHAEEHMMFRGSPGLTADQLANILAAMGGMFNADTQQTVTQYFLVFPSADIDIALRIEATRMNGILDDSGSWAQERGALEQEVSQDLSEPDYIFMPPYCPACSGVHPTSIHLSAVPGRSGRPPRGCSGSFTGHGINLTMPFS